MTEREEIGNGIEGIITDSIKRHNEGGLFAPRTTTQQILSYLNDNDVVIKVDRELPQNPHSDERTLHIKYNQGLKCGYITGQNSLLMAGYVAVEPLAKE